MNTNIHLPDELWRAAKVAAMDRRVSLAAVVAEALAAHLGVALKAAPKARKGQPRKK